MPYLYVALLFGVLGFANAIILTDLPKTNFGGCLFVPVTLLFDPCLGDLCVAVLLGLRGALARSSLVPCGLITESSRRVPNCLMIDLPWTCLVDCRQQLSLGAAFTLDLLSKCRCLRRWCRQFSMSCSDDTCRTGRRIACLLTWSCVVLPTFLIILPMRCGCKIKATRCRMPDV